MVVFLGEVSFEHRQTHVEQNEAEDGMGLDIHKWNMNKWIFNDVHKFGFPFYHIHPFKQEYVKKVVHDKKPSWIEQIIIFGSAVHPWHFYEKDIDICFIGRNPNDFIDKAFLFDKKINTDVLVFESLEDLFEHSDDINSVRHDIMKEGVLIYG